MRISKDRATRINGPINIQDPFNKINNYDRNSANQPLLDHIGKALLDQLRQWQNTEITRYTFSTELQLFILQYLKYTNPKLSLTSLIG